MRRDEQTDDGRLDTDAMNVDAVRARGGSCRTVAVDDLLVELLRPPPRSLSIEANAPSPPSSRPQLVVVPVARPSRGVAPTAPPLTPFGSLRFRRQRPRRRSSPEFPGRDGRADARRDRGAKVAVTSAVTTKVRNLAPAQVVAHPPRRLSPATVATHRAAILNWCGPRQERREHSRRRNLLLVVRQSDSLQTPVSFQATTI